MTFGPLYQGIHEGLPPIGTVLVLPYSNLAALTRAAEYARLYQALLVLNWSIITKHSSKGQAVAEIIVNL
jgi:hypothetical protein